MSDTAFQTMYRQEAIAAFESSQSLLRDTVTTEAMIKGNTAVFLVAGSGGATAVTRGVDGRIPGRADDLTQNSCTLREWHDKVVKTGFNIFASQGNQREIMQRTTMGVINRKVDSDIFTELNTGTLDTGAVQTGSLALALRAKTILGNNKVPFDGNIASAITPAFEAYLLQIPEFGNAQWVSRKPVETGETAFKDAVGFYRWMGVNWVVHPELPGVGTAAEKCFMYHKSAIGHAANKDGMQTPVGYNDEDDYSFARASIFMGSKLLQNSGVVVINHDGSAFAAE